MKLIHEALLAIAGIILVIIIGFSIPLTEEQNTELTARAFDLPWVWR